MNSAHHQAVKEKGEGFEITARTQEGIVEAMENRSKRFVLGVQYHPERMIETADFQEHRRKLFEAFIQAASRIVVSNQQSACVSNQGSVVWKARLGNLASEGYERHSKNWRLRRHGALARERRMG